MKILITGVNGQVGHDIARRLYQYNTIIGIGRQEHSPCSYCFYYRLDLTNKDNVQNYILSLHPDVIIHCAAWTDVDKAQLADNIYKVYDINVNATRYLVQICKKLDIPLFYLSTDYVFNEPGDKPISPECKNFNPLNVYGKTKLEGEQVVSSQLTKYFIIRTSWVFSDGPYCDFVFNMLHWSSFRNEVVVIDDQYGRPTYSRDLANTIASMINSDKYGYYHITNSGQFVSWAEFCEQIFFQAKRTTKIIRCSTEQFGSIADRPHNSRLDISKIIKNGFLPMPDWKNSLSWCINDYRKKYEWD